MVCFDPSSKQTIQSGLIESLTSAAVNWWAAARFKDATASFTTSSILSEGLPEILAAAIWAAAVIKSLSLDIALFPYLFYYKLKQSKIQVK
jgi:hypothetical protein